MKRIPGLLLLLALGVASLPVAAFFLDGPATENWVLPVQLVGMAVVGGLCGVLLPGLASGRTGRRFAVGAAYGLGSAVAGYALFFLLIHGLHGA